MALPLAIPAIVAEGLVFIRRAIVTYRLTKQLVDPDDKIHLLVSKGVKDHFSVKGEEFYLYLVGERIIISIYDFLSVDKNIRLNEKQIEAVVLKTLASPEFLMASLDVNSIISSFARVLGIQWQMADGNADDYLTKLLSKDDDESDISDVVRKFISSSDDLPERLMQIAHRLGLINEELMFVITLLKGDETHSKILSEWEDAEKSFISQGVPLYKASTFQGFMLIGAQTLTFEERQDLIAVPGLDGIGLNMSYLPRGKSFEFKPDQYPDFVSITQDQVKMASEKSMRLQGLVYSAKDQSWVPMSHAEVMQDEDSKLYLSSLSDKNSVLYSKGVSNDKSSSKMIFSLIESYIKDQPLSDDFEEWTQVLESGRAALKLISNG